LGLSAGGEDARGSRLASAHLAGEQTHAVMLCQKLEPRVDLLPSGGGEQLLGIRAVGKRRLLEAKEGFPH